MMNSSLFVFVQFSYIQLPLFFSRFGAKRRLDNTILIWYFILCKVGWDLLSHSQPAHNLKNPSFLL